MKKILIILFSATIISCTSQPSQKAEEIVCSLNSTFARVGEKYAVADASGNPISEYIYDNLEGLSSGNILAQQNGRQFLLDKEGRRMNDLEFDEFNYCFNNCAIIKEREQYGLITIYGQTLLPAEYDNITFITTQLAAATKGNCTTIADIEGTVITQTLLPADSILQNISKYRQLHRQVLLSNEKYWSSILDRYDSLCRRSLEAKVIAKGTKISKAQAKETLQQLLQEAMAIEQQLKESSGKMTLQQFDRFKEITERYAAYEK